MEHDEIETIADLCDYIIEHADNIFVRERVFSIDYPKQGKLDNYALTELPTKSAIKHALGFIKENRIPVRLLQKDEI